MGKRNRRKPERIGKCCFCGTEGVITDDHIPPKNLFRDIPDNELIKVPGCIGCNGESKKDDEYFRAFLIAHDGVAHQPQARKLNEHVRGKFDKHIREKGQMQAFEHSLRLEIHEKDVFTPAGIYVGRKTFQYPDHGRIERLLKKYLVGLHFHFFNSPFPSDKLRVAVVDSRQRGLLEKFLNLDLGKHEKELQKAPEISIRKIFGYRCLPFLEEIPNIIVWELTFFDHRRFFGVAYPKMMPEFRVLSPVPSADDCIIFDPLSESFL